MRYVTVGFIVALATSLAGCGSSGYSGGGGPPPTCSGSTPVALTVKNFDSWCSVSVAGMASSTSSTVTDCVAAGQVALSATALAGFELGSAPWHDTDGDHGSGDPGTVTGSGQSATSSTTVTVSGSSACAWVCCPFAPPTAPGCPTSNLCP